MTSKKKSSLYSKAFLEAANLQSNPDNLPAYSCLSLLFATHRMGMTHRESCEVRRFYTEHFKPTKKEFSKMKGVGSDNFWWPKVKGRFDNESRILALLLAAEISKDIS